MNCSIKILRWAMAKRILVTKCLEIRYVNSMVMRNAVAYSTMTAALKPDELMEKVMTLFGVWEAAGVGQRVRCQSPRSQEELPERCMQDSFTTVVIPLASNRLLRRKYATPLGSLRTGRLVEYMDMFAVWTTIQHVSLPAMKPGYLHPYTVPTVHVDSIDFTDYTPRSDLDVRYCGRVSWAGRSSCEVSLWVEQDTGDGQCERIARASFVMVVRDFLTYAPALLNKLVPRDDSERLLLAEAEGRKKQRERRATASLLRAPPDPEEQAFMHQLFLGSLPPGSPIPMAALPPHTTWLGDTTHICPVTSHKEDENIHGTVFGGFIMRHVLEASEACARLHSKQQPRLICVSDLQFFKGVELGALFSMHAQVVFTQGDLLQVMAHGEVMDADSGRATIVCAAHCTYHSPEPVLSVLPHTYTEAMKYLDGRRHLMRVMDQGKKL